MGKYLLLLLCFTLLLDFTQGLTCIQCDRTNVNGVCDTKEGFCETHSGQQCLLQKIYEDDKLQYARQSCSSLCSPMSLFYTKFKVEFTCCNNASFCNKL
ncbi:PREDICTED: secreted seminal-vesicle Ly-6 protein 1-like [Chinchilla lanigera]|uniref:secreted seminal-vesicle Ly-6 protein 1-like n=1 Tax=Chinchilla lanigera TaxID=34839 RepID=UPI00038EB6EF|nr:PREDICTED: secreted seminal-vesicle Ly-6 protein 1-like [Chinchilla lanigera]